MDAPERTNTRKLWLAVAIALVAFPAAYLVLEPTVRDWSPYLTTSDADIRLDVEKTFETFKTYQALKEHYPQAYEQLVAMTVTEMRNGTDSQKALAEGAEFTSDLRRRNARYYAMASVERLRLSLGAQIPQYKYLKTAYGFKACNELAVKGGVAITQMLGPEFSKDDTLVQLMDDATGYFFRTTAEGQKLKLQHAQPTQADWRVAADYLAARGMTQADLVLVTEPQKHLDDSHLCDAVIRFYDGITVMDNDAATRILPYLAAGTAAS